MVTLIEPQKMIGHSQVFDVNYRVILNNGVYYETNRGVATVGVSGGDADYRPVVSRHPMAYWLVSTIMAMMRDLAGVTVVQIDEPFTGAVCPGCGGEGGYNDHEGNYHPCEMCGEDGMV